MYYVHDFEIITNLSYVFVINLDAEIWHWVDYLLNNKGWSARDTVLYEIFRKSTDHDFELVILHYLNLDVWQWWLFQQTR